MNAPLNKEQIALLMSDSLTYRSPVVPGTDGTVAAPRPSAWDSLRNKMVAVLDALADLPRRRAVLAELEAMNDRELADIGLRRCDLKRVFDPRFAALMGRG